MATLIKLEAQLLKHEPDDSMTHVSELADADGVMFLCPKCWEKNGGRVGTHSIICWFTGKVADDVTPAPGRWNPSGTGLNDLTFVGPGLTSVWLTGGCGWHGHVVGGCATLA